MAEIKYCNIQNQKMEINRSDRGYYICQKSLPVTDCCKQYDCIFHNAKTMEVMLKSAMFNPELIQSWSFERYQEYVCLSHLGGKNYCTKKWFEFWK